MADKAEARLGAVRALIEQSPDNVVRDLDKALRAGGPSLAQVRDIVAEEVTDRKVRGAVLAPFEPLCQASLDQPPLLPSSMPRLLWRALKQDRPRDVAEAKRITLSMRRDDGPPEIYDQLCQRAAEGLKSGDAAFAEAAGRIGDPALLQKVCRGLNLTGLSRTLAARLPGWVRNMNGEAAAALRLAFKDATANDSDAAPTLMEMIYGQLEEPWQVLRVISAVMDRPSDRYLEASEMASFGQRLLDNIDARVDAIRKFDANDGPAAATELATSIQVVTLMIAEFETWLEISKDGPWGLRLTKARKNLAGNVEARLRESISAVSTALPSNARAIGKITKLTPRTSKDLDKDAVRRGYALLTFLAESRSSAAHGGFGSMRKKVIEDLDSQVDQYADDLIDALHEGGDDAARIASFIEVAADYLGLIRDPKAAEIIRRRAAVA